MTSAETEPTPDLAYPTLDNVAGSTASPLLKRLHGIVKRVLPSTLVSAIRVVAELRPVSSSLVRRMQSVAIAWHRTGKRPILPSQAKSVVFICHGNIMRSPVAEAMLKRELAKHGPVNVTVSSAGMHAINGRGADPRAQTVAPEFGVSVSGHWAQVVTQSLVDSSDLLVVMDIQNAAEFLLRYPRASNRLFVLRQFSEQSRGAGRDIPDPYPGDEEVMRQCCGMLRECIDGLTAQLCARQKKAASF